MTLPNDLLEDGIITIATSAGHERVSLPDLFVRLAHDDVDDFPNLRPHQRPFWFLFLAQLGAIVRLEGGDAREPITGAGWRTALLALTAQQASAWQLVVQQPDLPAFLQPPTPKGTKAPDKPLHHPDELDLLVTAKNHDVKMARMSSHHPEAWLFALVTLQTGEGYLGAGNYGIARMNGGFASRPMVAITTSTRWGIRWLEAIHMAARHAPAAAGPQGMDIQGHILLWCLPWDGTQALAVTSLHPLAIEVCRRVRLDAHHDGLCALLTSTKSARVDAKDRKGVLGDPWLPIEKADSKALTISDRGFDASTLLGLLTYDVFVPTPSLDPTLVAADGGWLVAQGITRGQGKTAGYHERWVPLPKKISRRLKNGSERDHMALRGRTMLDQLTHIRTRVLFPALRSLVNAGRDGKKSDFDTRRWTHTLRDAAEAEFFLALWRDIELPHDDATRHWLDFLGQAAKDALETALQEAPVPASRRTRAIATAENVFGGALHNYRTKVLPEPEEAA